MNRLNAKCKMQNAKCKMMRTTKQSESSICILHFAFCILQCCVVTAAIAYPLHLSSTAQADPPKPAKAKSIDEELLKGLGDDPLAEKPKAKSAEPKAGAKPKPQDELDKQLLQGLGEGEDIGAENPLVRIGREMRKAGTLIGQSKAGDETQELQKKVMADIDRLIQRAKQQQSQQSASSKQQQTARREQVKQAKPGQGEASRSDKPAIDSTDTKDRGGKADLRRLDPAALSEVIKRAWGNLPEKQREEMLQNGGDKFLPKYELLIEEYYKALAERQDIKR